MVQVVLMTEEDIKIKLEGRPAIREAEHIIEIEDRPATISLDYVRLRI